MPQLQGELWNATENIQINHGSPSLCGKSLHAKLLSRANLVVQEVELRRSCWGPLPPVTLLCVSVPWDVPAVQSTSHIAGKKVTDYAEQSGQLDSWRSVR